MSEHLEMFHPSRYLDTSRVLVCGGRHFPARWFVWKTLDLVLAEVRFTTMVHGDCETGADRHAADWAKDRRVASWAFPAEWQKHGRAAGPMRNERMMREARPALVLAFPGHTGTAGMCEIATTAGATVRYFGEGP